MKIIKGQNTSWMIRLPTFDIETINDGRPSTFRVVIVIVKKGYLNNSVDETILVA